METETVTENHQPGIAQEGKYLTFALGQEEYGLEILKIREIIGILPITPMPNTPHYIKGVINLRGKIIPVADLRLKFGMPEIPYSSNTCIIVIEVGQTSQGIIVDRVCEVCNINEANIEPTPNFGATAKTDFITGMGKVGEKVRILLDIEKILSEENVQLISPSAVQS